MGGGEDGGECEEDEWGCARGEGWRSEGEEVAAEGLSRDEKARDGGKGEQGIVGWCWMGGACGSGGRCEICGKEDGVFGDLMCDDRSLFKRQSIQ